MHEKATALGKKLRKNHGCAHITDHTSFLDQGDIFILCAGAKYNTSDLLHLANQKKPSVLIVDSSEKKNVKTWIKDNTKNSKKLENKTYFLGSLKRLSGFIASSFYEFPSEKIIISAITGTNGKTTVANAAAIAFANCKEICASLGTLGLITYKKNIETIEEIKINDFDLTTPSAVLLHRNLNELIKLGVERLFIEASSIGLIQGRLLGCKIRHTAMTNLGHDHLDYHGSFENLEFSKSLLFTAPDIESAVFTESNRFSKAVSERIIRKLNNKVKYFYVSAKNNRISSEINLKINSISDDVTNVTYQDSSSENNELSLTTIGKYNIENAAVVAGLMHAAGKKKEEIISGLKKFKTPLGRMDFLKEEGCPLVCIDYAHTPEALERILTTLRDLSKKRNGKLYCIFGCGGDRDKSKRKKMGKVATKYCTKGIITSDNPRTEPLGEIIADIYSGIDKKIKHNWRKITNRGEAINHIVSKAKKNDVVLVAGKGHENYQIFDSRKIYYSDYEETRSAFNVRKLNLEK